MSITAGIYAALFTSMPISPPTSCQCLLFRESLDLGHPALAPNKVATRQCDLETRLAPRVLPPTVVPVVVNVLQLSFPAGLCQSTRRYTRHNICRRVVTRLWLLASVADCTPLISPLAHGGACPKRHVCMRLMWAAC